MAADPGPNPGSGSGSDSEPEQYFGMEQPPLIKQLKGILSEYPDDGQIIKELVQNAEDAGANTLQILYDGRQLEPKLDRKKHIQMFFKGPALCFYNDALFSDDDWRGIRMIYSSVKEEDPLKVGRFGLGFKSVFHITDCPWVLSGKFVLFMNPLQRNPNMVCTRLNLSALRKSKRLNVPDFLTSLKGIFGVDKSVLDKGFYNGTIFRFPLRDTESELSDSLYNQGKIMDLFTSFQTEAPTILLFLKSLSKVELFCRNCESDFTLDRSFFIVEITGDVESIIKDRKSFTEKVKSTKTSNLSQPIYFSSQLCIKTTKFVRNRQEPETSEREWMVVNFLMAGKMSPSLLRLIADESLSYSPYVGVAFPLDDSLDTFIGHVFCFLPLPQERKSLTGLPVHVNGFFALSQNRRHLKWPSADQTNYRLHTDKSIEWNKCLLREVLPKAYTILVKEMISHFRKMGMKDPSSFYKCLPDTNAVDAKWQVLVDELYKLLLERNFIYTQNDGGKWIKHTEAVYGVFTENEDLQSKMKKNIKDLVLQYNFNLAEIPTTIWDALVTYTEEDEEPRGITAAFVTQLLKKDTRYKNMTADQKLLILEFIIEEKYQNAAGLDLLPLDDGSFTAFARRERLEMEVYTHDKITDELFPGQEKHFLRNGVGTSRLRRQFQEMTCSECFQLRGIGPDAVAALLQKTIPHQVRDGNCLRDDRMQWLKKVWKYLLQNFPANLATFRHLMLLPKTETGHGDSPCTVRLHSLSDKLILGKIQSESGEETDEYQLPASVCVTLQSMSVIVVPSLPSWIPYQSVRHFIRYPSPGSVLKFIGEYSGNINNVQLPKDEKSMETFVKFLSGGNPKDVTNARRVLMKLKLFKQTEDPQVRNRFVSLSENKNIHKPDDHFPVKYPMPLVVIKRHEQKLAALLDACEVHQEDLLLMTLNALATNRYDRNESNKFMLYFLPVLKDLEDDHKLVVTAKNIKFVERENGQLCKASEIFDRTDVLLRDMFLREDVFPSEKRFLEGSCLEGMRVLGMKGRLDVQPSDLLSVANNLDRHCCNKDSTEILVCKSTAFMKVLEENHELLNVPLRNRRLSESISNLRCIAVVQEKPPDYPDILPWFDPKSVLCKPCEVKSYEFLSTVGSVAPLIQCGKLPNLSHYFPWSKAPTTAKVFQQLDLVISEYASTERHALLPIIYHLYSELLKRPSKEVKKKLTSAPDCRGHIWNGDGFCCPENLYLQTSKNDINATPYMYPLPGECKTFVTLFRCLGCFEEQNLEALLHTQEMMKRKYDTKTEFPEDEVERDLNLTVRILWKLSKLTSCISSTLVPVHTGSNKTILLKPAQDCTFCDADSLEDVEFEEEDTIFYVHEVVKQKLAKSLGVKSLTESALKLADAEDWEAKQQQWEQDEPLTTRIRTLLTEYTDGLSVPKELIQNADDAGATVICFLYDERENADAKTHLLSPEMAECQGPALWVYNNKKFTKEDMINIKKLNGATKEQDEMKIGKFGLGFCSVFNLTDVPIFVSGHDAVIFDPNMTHLPGRSKGKKIDLNQMKRMKMMKRIKNQFKTFEGIFGCSIMSAEQSVHFDGTLFRLALRTEKQAKSSEISDQPYTKTDVKVLLDMFMNTAGTFLMFSQNIKSIALYHLGTSQNPDESSLIFNVRKSGYSLPGKSITPALHETSALKRNKQLQSKPFKRADVIDIEMSTLKSPFTKSILTNKTKWIIGWATGTERSLKLTLNGDIKGALPLGSVAVLVEQDEDGFLLPLPLQKSSVGFYKNGYVFCFLPLPIVSDLEFHVNGCFSVTSDRRHLRVTTTDDKNSKESDWNEAILQDAVCRAFVCALENIRDNTNADKYVYHQLWLQQTPSTFKELETAFFKSLIACDHRLLQRNGHWVGLSQCVFLESRMRTDPVIGQLTFDALTRLHASTDLLVMDIPEDILQKLVSLQHKAIHLVTEKSFFMQMFFPTFDSPIWKGFENERNVLTQYALDSGKEYDHYIRSTKCIPTSHKKTLKLPSELISPQSSTADLFFIEDDMFPEENFCEQKRLQKLKQLGMQTEILSSSVLVERAEHILNLSKTCPSCAVHLSASFLRYLSAPQRNCGSGIMEELKKYKFLPVLEKPENWPFRWGGERVVSEIIPVSKAKCSNRIKKGEMVHEKLLLSHVTFVRPGDIYMPNRKELVGCVGLLLDDSCFKVSHHCDIMEQLGVKGTDLQSMDVNVIMEQLIHVMSKTESDDLSTGFVQIREDICYSVYKALDNICQQKDMSQKLSCLKEKPVLLVGEERLCPSKVALSLNYNCSPHLYGLNHSTKYYDLLKAMGVKKCFSTDDVLPVLQKMKLSWKENPLPETEIRLFVNILQTFCEAAENEEISYAAIIAKARKNMILPDLEGVLRGIDVVCMDDKAIKTGRKMKLLHPAVSEEIAVKLGVKTKRRQNFSDNSRKIPFGQNEKLVDRIKRILTGYPCDVGIMKELLQNADDAGATEIEFIKDYKQHSMEKIFDESCRPLQGPSLCVYNNSSFTEKDLEGIQSLGVGSKSEDPTKTGQYGVGFNAVYHLTDVPSFLSKGADIQHGETLCYLDPMCKFIPEATPEAPGLRLDDLDEFRESDGDIFEGYHERNYMKSKNGTMFRLPLRTEEMAKTSEISNISISETKMNEILDSFKNEMAEALLFVKSVRKISIVDISKGERKVEFTVSANLKKDAEKDRAAFFDQYYCKSTAFRQNVTSVLENKCIDVQYTLETADSSGLSQEWLIVQRLGFKKGEDIPVSVKSSYADGNLGLLPHGGVAVPMPKLGKENPADITAEQRKAQEATHNRKAFCFLPLPVITKLPVHIHGHFALDHENRRNIFTEEEGYKSDWNTCIMKSVISYAYLQGLQYIKLKLFPKNVEEKTNWSKMNDKNNVYHSFFPVHETAKDDIWKFLVKCIFETMITEEEDVFPIIQKADKWFTIQWLPISSKSFQFPAYFNELQNQIRDAHKSDRLKDIHSEYQLGKPLKQIHQKGSKVQRLMWQIEQSLRAVGLKLISSPISVYKSMQAAGVTAEILTPDAAIAFLKSHSSAQQGSCQLGGLDISVARSKLQTPLAVQCLLHYCSFTNISGDILNGVPLLVTEDGCLRKFSVENAIFSSAFCKLLPGSESHFMLLEHITSVPSDTTAVKNLTLESFVEMLPKTLSQKYFNSQVPIPLHKESKDIPNDTWVKALWKFFCKTLEDENRQADLKETEDENNQADLKETKPENREERHQRLIAKLNGLMPWSIIPASLPKCHETVPCMISLEKAYTTVDLSSFYKSEMMRSSIQAMFLPILDRSYDVANHRFQSLFATEEYPLNMLRCLEYHACHILKQSLATEQCHAVLEYFDTHLHFLQETKDCDQLKDMFLSLPLFVTMEKLHISLKNCGNVLAPPSDIPQQGIAEWANKTGTVLLIQNSKLEKLYKFVGCAAEETIDLYTKQIFPKFQHIPQHYQVHHIEYVKNHVLKENIDPGTVDAKQQELISVLKNLKFLHTKDGENKKASQFYSPHEPVFKAVVKAEEFPPEPYSSIGWKNFMIKVGVKATVTADMLIQFVTQLSGEGQKCVTKEYKKKVKTILDHLFQRENVFEEYLLSRIARIQFIPAHRVKQDLDQIHKQYVDGVIAFHGAVSKKDTELIWTSCPILPKWAHPSYKILKHKKELQWIKHLQIHSPPPFEKVLCHLENVCNALHNYSHSNQEEKSSVFRSADKILITLYDYLLNKREDVALKKERMHSLPLIHFPDNDIMVPAFQVILELTAEEEIRPYLYKFPIKYGMYFPVFEVLGCEKKATLNHFCMVLERVFKESKGQELHPEELRVTKTATNCVLKFCKSKQTETPKKVNLYLPNTNKVMKNSKDLVVVDNESYRLRIGEQPDIQYFLGFRELEIEVQDVQQTVMGIPEHIRPILLSDVVTEELDRGCLVAIYSKNKEKLERFLRAPEVLEGLVRLILHESSIGGRDPTEMIEEVSRNLQSVEVMEVSCLQTRLCYKGKTIPKTETSKDAFTDIQNGDSKQVCLYFQSKGKTFDQLVKVLTKSLAKILQDCTGNRIKQWYHLITLLHCIEDLEGVSKRLDEERIRTFTLGDKYFESVFPEAGTFVPPNFHDLLQQGFSIFEVGQYAAFEVSDPAVQDNFTFEADNEVEPVYVYVRIQKAIKTETPLHKLHQQYVIDVGKGRTETVAAYLLYKFTRDGSDPSGGELVPSGEGGEQQEPIPTLKEAFRSVRIELKEAWKLPEMDRKKIIKRLLLRWHPDKNKENEEMCTKVFQYIQHIISKLLKGEPVDEDDDEDFSGSNTERHRDFRTYSDFYEEIFRRGRSHGNRRNRRRKNRGRGRWSHFQAFRQERTTVPTEGQRWLHQARIDLSCARELMTSMEGCRSFFNWACYLCHQATEKGLKAAWFIKDANKVTDSSNLVEIAKDLGIENLADLAHQMTSLLGNDRQMRYPDVMQGDRIPSDLYSREKATRACELAERVLRCVSTMYP